MKKQLIVIYITTDSVALAEKISAELLSKKLIACSNVIPEMQSHFFWQGQKGNEQECILLVKTIEQHFDKIESVVQNIHTYDCPCIFSLPITNCSENYRRWVIKQLSET